MSADTLVAVAWADERAHNAFRRARRLDRLARMARGGRPDRAARLYRKAEIAEAQYERAVDMVQAAVTDDHWARMIGGEA